MGYIDGKWQTIYGIHTDPSWVFSNWVIRISSTEKNRGRALAGLLRGLGFLTAGGLAARGRRGGAVAWWSFSMFRGFMWKSLGFDLDVHGIEWGFYRDFHEIPWLLMDVYIVCVCVL